jgi:hypothetical protein
MLGDDFYELVRLLEGSGGEQVSIAVFVPEGVMSVEISAPYHIIVFAVVNKMSMSRNVIVQSGKGLGVVTIIVDVEDGNPAVRTVELNDGRVVVVIEIDLMPMIRV